MCEFLSYHCMLRKLGYHNRFPYFFLFLSSVFSTAQAIEICYIFGSIKYMLKHAKMMNPFQFYMCFPWKVLFQGIHAVLKEMQVFFH